MKNKRTVLITGASGFIGCHVAERFSREGWKVLALVRPASDTARLERLSIETVVHDGSSEGLAEAFHRARPDLVIHLASLFLASHSTGDLEPLVKSNLLFPVQLLDAMRGAGARFLINTGTAWQHFENRAYDPVNLYAATKQAFEALMQYYVEAHGLCAMTLKIFDSYGPGDERKKLFWALREARAGRLKPKMSPGDQKLDLVHIDDIVEAYWVGARRLLAGKVERPEIYAVSSGKPVPLKEVVAEFEKASGTSLPVEWGARPYRSREVMVPWSRGNRLPGWEPRISLSEGIRNLFASS